MHNTYVRRHYFNQVITQKERFNLILTTEFYTKWLTSSIKNEWETYILILFVKFIIMLNYTQFKLFLITLKEKILLI